MPLDLLERSDNQSKYGSYYKPQEVNGSIISWGVPQGLSPKIAFAVCLPIMLNLQHCHRTACISGNWFYRIVSSYNDLSNNENVPQYISCDITSFWVYDCVSFAASYLHIMYLSAIFQVTVAFLVWRLLMKLRLLSQTKLSTISGKVMVLVQRFPTMPS